MSSATRSSFTVEEERAIAHIASISTTLFSTCHVCTGYDEEDAGRYPYTANILQSFSGSFTAMYDECRGASRLHALLSLLREVEIDMYKACRQALQQSRVEREGEREGERETGGMKVTKVTKVTKRRRARGKGEKRGKSDD